MIDKFKADLKDALRGKDRTAVATLRMLISQAQYIRIDLGRALEEENYLTLLQRAVKTRREAIALYEQGGRADRAEQERAEIAVVERYLPAAMGPDELARAVDTLLEELSLSEKKDLGRAMKEFMARYRGRADGKVVNALIVSRLK